LGHPDDRIVDGHVAMGMVLTDNIADDPRRFLVGLVPVVVELVHRMKDAPVNGLQAISHIGQRPADDDAHGVVHVGLFHFIFDIYNDAFRDHGQKSS
jgi:hypothetical protein